MVAFTKLLVNQGNIWKIVLNFPELEDGIYLKKKIEMNI